MKIHRFIVGFVKEGKKLVVVNKDFLHQANRVLRFKIGENIILCDNNFNDYLVEIIELNKKQCVGKLLEIKKTPDKGIKKEITLYLPLIKKENFELSVQKAVELGVSKIVPLIAERSIKNNLNLKRLEAIIKEASEQSGRGKVAVFESPIKFEVVVKSLSSKDQNLFFDFSGSLIKNIKLKDKINIFIGPEGGWTENEVKIAKDNGLEVAKLNGLVLRAETAVITACFGVLQ